MKLKLLQFFKEKTPEQVIDEALSKGITDFWVGLTGGKDSIVVAHWIAENYPTLFKGCIVSKTGVGTNVTMQFITEYCKEMGWHLQIVEPKEGDDFPSIVDKDGFPHFGVHNILMRKLKIIPIREFLYSQTTESKIPCLVSGVRKKESKRRFIGAKKAVHKDHIWFVSPMINKSDSWMYAYLTEHKLKKSPVYETLHISGDCLCGCFSDKSEAKLIDLYYPELAELFQKLEARIRNNKNIPNAHKTWGNQNSITDVKNQSTLNEFCYECSQDRHGNSNQILKELDEIDAKLYNTKLKDGSADA